MRLNRHILSYGVAVLSTAIASILALWLEGLLSPLVSPLFYIAIAISTWYGGIRPGIVSVVLSALIIQAAFLPPVNQLILTGPEDLLRLSIFLLVALTINLLIGNLRHSRQKIEQLNQQLLQTNTEQLRMVLSAVQMGLWDWDIVTGEIQWSPEHEQLFGIPAGCFDGEYATVEACIHPEDRSGVNQSIQQAILTRSHYQREFRVVWVDGSIHWIEGRGRAFYNEAGEPIRMSGTVISISDRKQTEALLNQQFDRQRTVMEIGQHIRQSLNLEEILNTTVEDVRQLLQTDRVIIFQFAPNGSGTVVVESVGDRWLSILSTQIYDPCFKDEYVELFRQGLVTAKSDVRTAGIAPCHLELLLNFQVVANLVVPILQGEELWGLLIAHHCSSVREWQPSEIELLQQLATQVGIAIQQAALVEQLQTELRERRATEAALRESEQKFRQLAEQIQEVFFLYTVDFGDVLYINPAYETIWQRSCASLYQNPFSFIDSVHADDRERISTAMQGFINGDRPFQEEYRILRPNGSIRWVYTRTFFVYNDRQEAYRVAGLATDITARKQAEIALQQLNAQLELRVAERTAELTEAERRWRYLLDRVQLVVVGLDCEGRVDYVNTFFLKLTGYQESEVLGKCWFELCIPSTHRQSMQRIFTEILTDNRHSYYQNSILTKAKEERFIAWNNTLLCDSVGKIVGTISIGEDITERQKIEQMKNEFIGIVSHELRTPLTAIRASLGLLRTGIYDNRPDKFKRMIEIAAIDSDRLVRLVNDILDLERLESGRVVMDKTTCKAADLIQQAVSGVEAIACEQHIGLMVQPTQLEVWAAADAIIQTLMNLLSNAIKFSPPHTMVRVSVQPQVDRVLFQVQDRGRGIPADRLETIFGRFQQVDASDSRQKGGTGLGLAICRSIVEQHEGRIWAESCPGEGSTFFFTLPLPPGECR